MKNRFKVKSVIYLICLTLLIAFVPSFGIKKVSAEENSESPPFNTEEKITIAQPKDENSVIKDNGDGSFTKKIYSEPIYREENKEFKTISTDLVENKSSDEIQPKNTSIGVTFNSNMENGQYASFQNGSHQLIYKLIEAKGESETIQAKDVEPSIENNKVFHKEIFPKVDLRSVVFDSSVKEDLILDQYKGYNTFTYEINTNLIPKKEEDGSVSFFDRNNKVVYYLPKPFMTDSNIDEHSGEPQLSNNVDFELKKENDKWILSLVADETWLKSSKRVYPVYIDPSTSLGTAEDAFVSDAYPTTNYGKFWESSAGYYSLKVGNYDSSTGTNYSYIKPIISGLDNAIVDSATFNIYTAHSYYPTTATGVWLDEVNGNWSESSLTWNNKPSSTNIASDSVYKDQWAQFNVTNSVKDWVDGKKNNYGFKIHTNGNGQSYWKKFYASENNSNKPYLTVNYHYPTTDTPTANAFSNGNENKDGYVNLNWNKVNGATGYKVWIYNGKSYQSFSVGNTTSWTTKGKGIWPTSSEIAAGKYELHQDGTGTELSQDPSPVYKNSGGKYGSNTNYWFRISAIFDGGESSTSTEVSPKIPNLSTPITPEGTIYTNSDDTGYINLSWNKVSGATGYKVWIFNGSSYEPFDVGSVTSWTTKDKGIWPTDDEISESKYSLHTDGEGDELVLDPSPVYKNAGTRYATSKNYWVKISAYNSQGETITSGAYMPTMPNLEEPPLPTGTVEVDNTNSTGSVNLSWETLDNATGYKVWIFNGSSYEPFDVGNVTSWTTKGKGIWPTASEISSGKYGLHQDKTGTELSQDPSPVYKNAGTRYATSKTYWFRLSAYDSKGETVKSEAFMPILKNDVQTEGKPREDYTIKETEALLINYLKEKGLNSEVGSSEFTKYAIEQNTNPTDAELMAKPYYPAISAYLSEYVYAYEQAQGANEEIVEEPTKQEVVDKLSSQENKSIGQIDQEVEAEDAAAEANSPDVSTLESGNFTIMAASSSYSVSKAKAYAKKWYNKRNTYQYGAEDNDCTNFASQILYAGGKPKKSPSKVPSGTSSNTKYWYRYINDSSGKTPTFKKTTSWVGVVDFYSFWSRTQPTKTSTSKTTLINYAEVGDIIQFKDKDKTRFSHTMFVYDKGKGTLYLSGHTNNYLNKDFKKISPSWTKYRVIKF
ncbi:DNRLRE domain-containing protein [Priestia megaterium]|uniref:DNRLRE domain-containing protein n=1 Tax=Priestia megaterium TaxID=1404 RepID=UPI00236460DF|nr:DNRLRE domain-containing protein [Priestia megaterium]